MYSGKVTTNSFLDQPLGHIHSKNSFATRWLVKMCSERCFACKDVFPPFVRLAFNRVDRFYDRHEGEVGEAARKVILLVVRPPPQISGKRNFLSQKIAENGFWEEKNCPKIFGLKEPYFWPNIATNQLKKTTTLPTDNITL